MQLYTDLLARIRQDSDLVAAMWADAESHPDELDVPGTYWTVMLLEDGTPAAWCAATFQDDATIKCHSNYEVTAYRGHGLYEDTYYTRHYQVIKRFGLEAVTYLFEQPLALHEKHGWRRTGPRRPGKIAGHWWWELRREPDRPARARSTWAAVAGLAGEEPASAENDDRGEPERLDRGASPRADGAPARGPGPKPAGWRGASNGARQSEGISMTATSTPDITTDDQRWGFLTGAKFSTAEPWLTAANARLISARAFHRLVLVEALAAAADDEGQLLDFRVNEWFEKHVSDAMRDEEDPDDWSLTYNRFTAMSLSFDLAELAFAGWMAQRGNGDSHDYRLTLPPA
ncbi:hypothetical protein ACQPZJ_44575 [Actinoplanes sp. CA-054009]